jgi:hypothetical protein
MRMRVSLYPRSTVGSHLSTIVVDLKWGTIDFVEGDSSCVSIWAVDYGHSSEPTADALRALVAQLHDAVETAIALAAEASPAGEAPADSVTVEGAPSAASEVTR